MIYALFYRRYMRKNNVAQGEDTHTIATRNLLPSFATQNPPPSRREAIGRSKPLPYRHNVPYPPKGGISSRQRLVYHHALACISSHLGVYILKKRTCAISGGASPSPTGTLCRIRRTAVYHQGSALHIITPSGALRVYHPTDPDAFFDQGKFFYIGQGLLVDGVHRLFEAA